MRDTDGGSEAVRRLRALAGAGTLAGAVRGADPAGRAELCAAAYEVAWPLVYQRVTRPAERRRGHWRCSTGLTRLTDDCVDRFHDDVEAVVTDLLRNARTPVRDVEAWMSARLTAATVDGHRRRRGERGAQQRPRVPGWLAAELARDPWLVELATRVLDWVGVPESAGHEIWPVDSWAARRGELTGRPAPVAALRDDLDRVLAAMRRRHRWYADYVERPLGAKTPPLAPPPGDRPGDPRPLVPQSADDEAERRLQELAGAAVAAIETRLGNGEDPRTGIVSVLRAVFGDDRLGSVRLADPRVVDRIVREALLIVGGQGGPAGGERLGGHGTVAG
ncbi:hypothetical protein [Actinoplanes cyaneus]|nr:hypothetical protein [Actinoplanes cyaneus]MCW2140256.1 hypothetical protein [Actinoplanes cyaneus]